MKDAAENNIKELGKANKRLIFNLFLDPTLVVQARVEARYDLVDTFWGKYSYFTLCTKKSALQTCGSFLKGQVQLYMSVTRHI